MYLPPSIIFIFLSIRSLSVEVLSEITTKNAREELEETIENNPKRDIVLWRTNRQLHAALRYQTMFCGDAQSCAVPFSVEYKDTPCCSCSCADDCHEKGSCCLAMYDNITHMQADQRHSRYRCIAMKLLSNTSTTDYPFPRPFDKYITADVVSQCAPEYDDLDIVGLCAGDIKEPNLDSVVPVTEPVTNTHYKNKYCAYCNGVTKATYLKGWQLLTYAKQYISKTTKNAVSVIIETRGNIFYIPPEFVTVRRCFSTYTIGTCNVTGAWDEYKYPTIKDFETACETYIDPFMDPGGTDIYKNYFCYHCNRARTASTDANKGNCPYRAGVSNHNPEFVSIFDPGSLDRTDTQMILGCTGEQFQDKKLMLCHDVQCNTDQELVNGKCVRLNYKISGNQCFSVLLKVAAAKNVKKVSNYIRHDEKAFMRDILQELDDKLGLSSKTRGLHFVKEDSSEYIEYIVIYAVLVFNNVEEQIQAVDNLLGKLKINLSYNLHGDECIYFKDCHLAYLELDLELVGYNLSFTDSEFSYTLAELRITTGFQPDFKILKKSFNSSEVFTEACSANNTVSITKLHRCPFVAIPKNALTTEKINGYLRVFDYPVHSNMLKVLASWEYANKNDTIFICFRDYLDIYNSLPEQKYGRSSAWNFIQLHVYTFTSFSFYLIMYNF